MRRILLAVLSSAACVAVFVACSSSDSSTFTGNQNDSGSGDDSGSFNFMDSSGGNDTGGPAQCNPAMPSGSGTAWVPPTKQAVCSSTAIDAYISACLLDTSQRPDCDAYAAMAANATCVSCIEGKTSAGPIEWHATGGVAHHDYIVDFPACIDVENGVSGADTCGAAWHDLLECTRGACDACFATSGSSTDISRCSCAAEGGSFDSSNGRCTVAIGDGGTASFCTPQFNTRLAKCSGAIDAGSPAASSCLPASGETRTAYMKAIITAVCGM